jgi:hypothetical protein
MSQTKFEENLKNYFPDVYKLHEMAQWDKKIWLAVEKMLKMVDENSYGSIEITYQKGKINHITRSERV